MAPSIFIVPISTIVTLSYYGLNSYSVANAVMFLWASFVDDRLLPFITCSTVATAATWYVAILTDGSLLRNMMIKQGVHWALFLIGDMVIHCIPLLLVCLNPRRAIKAMQDYGSTDNTVQFCGWSSLFIHMFWYHVNNTDLNTIYIPTSPYRWDFLFAFATSCHILTMLWLRSSAFFSF